jgi:hypothetical protein
LANKSKEAHDRAEAGFKKNAQKAHEGQKAMAEYEAAGRAIREKTSRLRSLRLAKEAAEQKAALDTGGVKKKPAAAKKPPAASPEKR